MSEKPRSYTARLSELLTGGGRMVREPSQWHARILEGLPVSSADAVKEHASLTDSELARLLGVGEATLRRTRASGSALSPATGDRLYRFSKVLAVAAEVLQSEEGAVGWLRRAQPGLGGDVPLDLLVTQAGADEVETVLRRIQHGVHT
jgi:putative toxin-antitoxin system antitoxin component (TIGR02293 family)